MFLLIKCGNVSNIHDSWRESLLPLVIRVFKGPKMKVKVLVTQPCPTLCDPMNVDCQGLCPWDSPGKHTGEGRRSLLQGIFLTQGLNPHLLHCKQILYHLSHQGSPQTEKSCVLYNLVITESVIAWLFGVLEGRQDSVPLNLTPNKLEASDTKPGS